MPRKKEKPEIRRAGPADRQTIVDLSDIIWRHQTHAPVWGIHLPEQEVLPIPGEPDIFRLEDRAFVDSVKAGRNMGILATYEDGLKATAIAAAANESMATGVVVRVAA